MMVFDLICANKHTFEAWFKDSKSFEQLRRKGEVECPACGDGQVEKALMAPAVATSKKRTEAAKANAAMAVEAMQVLGKMRQHVEENCDYVGTEFAEEARKIHYGETEVRNIHGDATQDEAKALKEEGVAVAMIPWPSRHDS